MTFFLPSGSMGNPSSGPDVINIPLPLDTTWKFNQVSDGYHTLTWCYAHTNSAMAVLWAASHIEHIGHL